MRYGVDTLPHVQYVYKKKLGVCWGLVDKISPAFELRNSGVQPGVFVGLVTSEAGLASSLRCQVCLWV
jgi:hypothetical protein